MITTLDRNELRKQIRSCTEKSGIRLTFMAEQVGWKYHLLNDFRRCKANPSEQKLRALKSWLDAHEPRQ